MTLYNTNSGPLAPALPPPPHAPPPSKSNLLVLYYGLVVVGTAAIVFAIYNLTITKWCTDRHRQSRRPRAVRTQDPSSRRSFNNLNINSESSFKYEKGKEFQGECYDNYECSVCLSYFEEGEDIRQLPRCKHSFHAQCIDMWLYSHMDCPLCRSQIELPVLRGVTATAPSDNSREGLIESEN